MEGLSKILSGARMWDWLSRVEVLIGLGLIAYAVWKWFIRWRLPLPRNIELLRAALLVGESYPRVRALGAFVYCWRHRHGVTTRRAVQAFIEYQILTPRPLRSFICPQSPDGPGTAEETQEWDEAFEKFFLIERAESGTPTIGVRTCFDLAEAEDRIERYLVALKGRRRFECLVKVDVGFFAALHLLSGLLDHFDENWNPVMEAFGTALRAAQEKGVDAALQLSMFDIWLLWGPSIPICRCPQFGAGVALQYGYGDENNSVCLLFAGLDAAAAEVQKTLAAVEHGKPVRPIATQAEVTGRLVWGPEFTPRQISLAQQNLLPRRKSAAPGDTGEKDRKKAEAKQTEEDRSDVPLILMEPTVTGHGSQLEDRYYTAYVWVMFVLTDEHGHPLFENERWRNLYPFFEHANIANVDAYLGAKQQLAEKALATITRLGAATKGVRFAYVGAVDDSACTPNDQDRLLFPTPKPYRIRDILEGLMAARPSTNPAIFRLNKTEPTPEALTRLVNEFSTCHLPEIINGYYAVVSPSKK